MMKLIKPFILVILSVTCVNIAFARSLDSVAAVVNQEVITQSELHHAMTQASAQLAASQNPNAISPTALHAIVLNQLIDQKLQLQLAKKAKVNFTEAQVTHTIKNIAKQNHLTVAQLNAQLIKNGMTLTSYRKMIKEQMIVHAVEQSAVAPMVSVTQRDIAHARAQYQAQVNSQQAFHVIDILLNSKKQAEDVIVRLKQGENIHKVVPNEAKDLGWQTANTLPGIFVKQLSHMKPGDISTPITAPNGIHVLKLVGVRGQPNTLTSAQLRNYAYQIKFQQAVKNWLKQVRKTAYVKISQ